MVSIYVIAADSHDEQHEAMTNPEDVCNCICPICWNKQKQECICQKCLCGELKENK